jgi:DNA-binding NarL/FixJ family response regulator
LAVVPVERTEHEAIIASVRARLAAAVFDPAWRSGEALSLDAAIADALASAAILAREFSVQRPEPAPERHGLTRREHEVLRQLAAGRSNREIAAVLFIAEHTVENHVLHFLSKLNVGSRTAAAAYAFRNGLA